MPGIPTMPARAAFDDLGFPPGIQIALLTTELILCVLFAARVVVCVRTFDRSVDYTLMDELVVQYLVDNHAREARTRLQFGSTPLITRQLHLAVRRTRPDAAAIVDRFNAQLRAMIADRTYHRLLRVAWIRADVDSDGLAEYVPYSDRPGPLEPQRAYALFSAEQPVRQPPDGQRRFYVGGNIYTDWAAVPDSVKGYDSQWPDPSRSSGTIFRFTW